MVDKKVEITNAAREIFRSKGFKETNISEIAKMAGIGVGTFYNYYSSKEELFSQIFIKENEDLKRKIFESVNPEEDPVTLITKIVSQNALETNSNPILKEWYNKELFGKLEKYFYEHGGFESIDELTNSGIIELVRKWKEEGKLRKDIDDQMIIAIFKSIPYIDIHKNEIGIQHFPDILFHITEFVMKGLTEFKK